ncbi:hypothetical protein CF326_g6508 [Tilletia indica]|nr:hypothetical protein CF326_g6508 [Tilletia indica]
MRTGVRHALHDPAPSCHRSVAALVLAPTSRLFQHAVITLIAGLIVLQVDNSDSAVIFGVFRLTIVPALILAQTEPYHIMASRWNSSDRAGYFFAFALLVQFFSVTLAQAIAALSPSIYMAAITNPFLIIIFSLFCGVTITKPNIPGYWRSWLYQLDPFTRLVGGLVANELGGLESRCATGPQRRISAIPHLRHRHAPHHVRAHPRPGGTSLHHGSWRLQP